jgi:hypothetical protein
MIPMLSAATMRREPDFAMDGWRVDDFRAERGAVGHEKQLELNMKEE